MKYLLLLAFMSVGFVCFSQTDANRVRIQPGSVYLNNVDTIPQQLRPFMSKVFVQRALPYLPQAKVIGDSKMGDVYALPQDGMVCAVPDMKQFSIMPNTGAGTLPLIIKEHFPGKIRNGSPVTPIVPLIPPGK